RRVKGRDPGRVRLELAELVRPDSLEASYLVLPPAPLELFEPRELAGVRRDDHLAEPPHGDVPLVAVGVELTRTLHAQPGLQRARLVVDAGVDDARGASCLMGADPQLALQHRDADAVVAERQLASHREPDDSGADDDDVAFASRIGVGHDA